jgi:hypothetical protein
MCVYHCKYHRFYKILEQTQNVKAQFLLLFRRPVSLSITYDNERELLLNSII